jgi:hypothetical protein
MSLDRFRRTLATNRMIFDVRRDMALVKRFADDLEGLMEEYRLTPAERDALRKQDLKQLSALGIHPYFLTQITRLFHGSAANHNDSAAIRAYRSSLLGGSR